MRRNNWWLLGLFIVVSSGVGAVERACAQQLKPYFLVIVDTSGSMAWCATGTSASAGCSCHEDNNCSRPFLTNRCGFPSNRIGDAKCSLQRILDGTGGDAIFGLMQFEHPCDNNCLPTGTQCTGSEGSCGAACDDAQLAVTLADGNNDVMREWVDGECQGTCGANDFRHELTTGQWTPLAKSLQRANEYLRGTNQSISSWPYVTGGSLPPSPLGEDPQLKCRPVSVILLTDGEDTCVPTAQRNIAAPAAAAALYAGTSDADNAAGKAFRTYVIGFGAAGGGNFNPATLNNIANMGGTTSYYNATSEAELSLALTNIVAKSQPPAELCNNQDDDCDSKIDEGIPKYCDKPKGQVEATLCDEPNETNCDGIDDDCDGVIDEGVTNACGECGPLPKEICDNLDNDCDSRIDENASNQETCGSDRGECQAGQLVCVRGMEQCEGQIGPMDERCDCKDNDCDGTTDEAGSSALCPSGQRCAGCQCVEFCKQTTEFVAQCPTGLTPSFQANGECLCIADNCDHVACPRSTLETSDGEVSCAPNDNRVGSCECRAGACVAPCSGVTCGGGEVCDPRHGVCVEDSCRGLGCQSDELCDPSSGSCVADLCKTQSCGADQLCRGGACEPSCASVQCQTGQRCTAGACEPDPCSAVTCGKDQRCDPGTGACAAVQVCAAACTRGSVCDALTGRCEVDPCWNVTCPGTQQCRDGQCELAGSDAGTPPESHVEPPTQLLAAGGGGCACSVPGEVLAGRSQPLKNGPLLAAWILFAAFGIRRWQRRSVRTRGLWFACVLLLVVMQLGACEVAPLCIDCVDGGGRGDDRTPVLDSGAADGGNGGAGSDADGGPSPDAGSDAGPVSDGGTTMPACVPTGAETCNDKDDDCDFKVDEDVQPTTACNQVGVCAGTQAVCTNGSFSCRFGAQHEPDESLCDGLDNDCDGKVDESFAMLGKTCELGSGACKVSGKFVCGSSGTSLSCDAKPSEPGEEVCNGKDDDCDGTIDEPRGEPGSNASYVKDAVVQLPNGVWIYQYEASRVDATADTAGQLNTRTCSRAGVLPWTNITYSEAVKACESVNMAICTLDEWLYACRSGDKQCSWSATSCTSYDDGACNGHTSNADALAATGSKSACHADFAGDSVFDLSGNAKEWTQGPMSPTTNPLRGGSYNNASEGLRCDFDFNLGAEDLRLPNIGFRCCSPTEP